MNFFPRQLYRLPLLAAVLFPSVGVAAGLRPLSTDRPDATESPYSVDAGHYQFETELGSWTRDGGEEEFSLMEINAKIGLCDSTDLQVVIPSFTHLSGGAEGFGDMQVRVKHNLWGNDGGPTALALLPYLQIPTANDGLGSDEFEGGLIVPFAFEGPAGWSIGVQGAVGLEADSEDSGHHLSFLVSSAAGHDLTETTGFFVELVGILSAEDGSDGEAYFNTGMTWAPEPMWQFDGGVRVGLTDASADVTPFLGVSTKF